jgi:hypothetical protein
MYDLDIHRDFLGVFPFVNPGTLISLDERGITVRVVKAERSPRRRCAA